MKSIAIIGLLLLIFGGCDLFNTRDAEIPTLARSNFQGATTPDKVIPNLENSFKDKNVVNYLACLSDSNYVFSPSSGAASLYQSFASWNKTYEGAYFNTLISPSNVFADSQLTLTITVHDSIPEGGGYIYSASYIIVIPFIDSSKPSKYQGDLKFYMSQDSRKAWSIYLWQDIKSTDFPSWSDLKGRLY